MAHAAAATSNLEWNMLRKAHRSQNLSCFKDRMNRQSALHLKVPPHSGATYHWSIPFAFMVLAPGSQWIWNVFFEISTWRCHHLSEDASTASYCFTVKICPPTFGTHAKGRWPLLYSTGLPWNNWHQLEWAITILQEQPNGSQ